MNIRTLSSKEDRAIISLFICFTEIEYNHVKQEGYSHTYFRMNKNN